MNRSRTSNTYMLRESHFVPHVPLMIAQHFDWLENIEVHRTTSSEEQFIGLIDGSIHFAATHLDNVLIWNEKGANVRAIAQIEQTTPLTFVGQPGRNQLSDLHNSIFATDANSNGFALIARYTLQQHGINAKFVEIGGVRERYEALLACDVDASLLGPPFASMAADRDLSVIASTNELFPDYPGQVLVVRNERTDQESEALARYLSSLQRAVEATHELENTRGREI